MLKAAYNKVAPVGIRTQTFESSLDQLVCPGDLNHHPGVLNLKAKQAHNIFLSTIGLPYNTICDLIHRPYLA